MGLSFIIVENAELDQYIAVKLIKEVGGEAEIKSFFTAKETLDHIVSAKVHPATPEVILLDLMMPHMSGLDFIGLYEALPVQVTDHYRIVVITSSMNKAELERLSKRVSVVTVIEKPLTREKFTDMLKQIDIG